MPKFQIRDDLTRTREEETNRNNFEENMVYTASWFIEEMKNQDKQRENKTEKKPS